MGASPSSGAPPTLTIKQLDELTRQTHYSQREIHQLHHQFMQETQSGFIPRQDFGELSSMLGINDPVISDMVFRMFDSNNDGYISFTEFIHSMSIMTRGTSNEKLEFAFKLYDHGPHGPKGFLVKSDLLRAMVPLHGMYNGLITTKGDSHNSAEALVDNIFNQMDANRDGRITFEEYKNAALNDPAIVQGLALF
eukprot:TRINITY_DN12310_c1_g1_i1.p1 TRINITY_DN12310_c1_g1~~TRINITY_DN12310_c1_g1_i1.p1  ORF type:complete len:194 (+),score=9.36 TRINITY_DN12310_c1_g1_i1:42-623(+)